MASIKPAKRRRPAGARASVPDDLIRRLIMIDPVSVERAAALGQGNVSAGIRLALELVYQGRRVRK